MNITNMIKFIGIVAYFHIIYADSLDSTQNLTTITLPDIITTVNKNEAEISSVNSSIKVVKEKQLLDSNIVDTPSLSNVFAGLILNYNGSSAFPTATLRGLSSPDYYSTTLNLYVDGVPQSPNFLIQALGDVSQIELLRGPQGTLYGENSQAGVISIITKNPMHGDYANVESSVSLLDSKIKAYGGGEILKDLLYAKANVDYTYDNGFIKDPDSNGNLNGGKSYAGGFSIYYMPLESFIATLSYNYQGYNNSANFYLSKTQYENGYTIANGSSVASNYNELSNPSAIYSKSLFDKGDAHSASLKLQYDFANSYLTSISAFQKSDTLMNTYPMVTINDSKSGLFYDTTQFIQEVRLNSDFSNGIESVVGVYYKYLLVDNGMNGLSAVGFRDAWSAKEDINTVALFADATIPLWGGVDVEIGGRYQYYLSSMDSNGAIATLESFRNSKDWHSFNPRISFGYTLNNHIKFYIAALQSTKQGGFVKTPLYEQDKVPYNPEQIYSIELGSHLKFLDNRLRAGIATYFMYIQDRQSSVGSAPYTTLKNIGDAYSSGLDIDIAYYGDRIFASFGININKAQYFNNSKNVDNTSTTTYDVRGQDLKYSPLFSLVANINWNFLRVGNHRFYLGGNARFSSSYYYDDLNQKQDLKQNPYVVLDLNLSYEYKNIAFTLYTQNTTNARYAIYAMEYGQVYYIPANPFNIGGKISYKF